MDDRKIVERRQRLIHHGRHQGCGIETVRPFLQPVLRDHAAPEQGGVDQVQRPLALRDRVGTIVEGGGSKLDAQLAPVDNIRNPPRTRLHRPGLWFGSVGCRRGVVHTAISSSDLRHATGGSSGPEIPGHCPVVPERAGSRPGKRRGLV